MRHICLMTASPLPHHCIISVSPQHHCMCMQGSPLQGCLDGSLALHADSSSLAIQSDTQCQCAGVFQPLCLQWAPLHCMLVSGMLQQTWTCNAVVWVSKKLGVFKLCVERQLLSLLTISDMTCYYAGVFKPPCLPWKVHKSPQKSGQSHVPSLR